jgi:hypothetical protein
MRLKLTLTDGDFGLAYSAHNLPNFTDKGYATPFNGSIAHDLIEHPIRHEAGHAGLQELEALGAITFFRLGYVGNMAGSVRRTNVRDIGADVYNMFPLFFEHGDLTSPAPSRARISLEIEEVLGDVVAYCKDDPDDLSQEYDWDSINWDGFRKLIGQRMSLGLSKFTRRFAKVEMWRVAEVFTEIHALTHNLPNTEPELWLDYSFTNGTARLLYPWEVAGNW